MSPPGKPPTVIQRCQRAVAPLHRRIFGWFAVAIAASILVGASVSHLLGTGFHESRRTYLGAQRVMANRFAEVWDEPARRRALAAEMASELDLEVTLRDAAGERVEQIGDACARPAVSMPVTRGEQTLGKVDLCSRGALGRPFSGLLSLLASVFVLWLVSHKISRWLSRPLNSLVKATDAIGRGQYDVEIHKGRHAPIEIVRLSCAVEDMAGKIKQQMKDQRELLASVSHELRSPLARIRLLLELMRDDGAPPNERKTKLVDDLEQEIVEMDDLVGGLLAQSRLDFSALTRRPHDVVALAQRAAERAGLALAPIVSGEPRLVECDATLLSRALVNLIDNAKKHAGGATGFNVRFEEADVVFEIEDRGPGIEDALRIFDPFYGTSGGSHDSLGLGLAIVRRIAQAHGGDAFARNRTGGEGLRGAVIGFALRATEPGPESL